MLQRLLSVLFVILGIALAFETWTIERYQRRLRDGALSATGTVVNALERRKADGAIAGVSPVIRFATATGDHVDFTAHLTGRSSPYAIGTQVPVYYHPDNPSFADLDDWRSRWLNTCIAGTLSLFAFIISGVLLRASRGQR